MARVEAEAVDIRTDFERRLTGRRRWTVRPRARALLKTIKQYYLWRERVRSDMMRVAAVLRQWHLELARRFVDRGSLDRINDYFFLLFDEIAAVIQARGSTGSPSAERTLRDIVAARRAEME